MVSCLELSILLETSALSSSTSLTGNQLSLPVQAQPREVIYLEVCVGSPSLSPRDVSGLTSTALLLPITAAEAGAGLVPPAVATHLLGDAGAILILIMLFMAIVSTGSSESIAVSSLVAYDIYREYFNPEASGADILESFPYRDHRLQPFRGLLFYRFG
jgi:hypothetical protein